MNPAALESFNSSFKNATEVNWTITATYAKADFAMNGQYVAAYYDITGKLIALTRNISSLQLPITLQASLKNSYENYWISDLFEVANDEGTYYYVTLENSDTKVVLKGSANSEWSTYQKSRKA